MFSRPLLALLMFFFETIYVFAAGNTLSSYGYIGNGSSHQLQTVTSYLGMNTTGWTLAQWQSVLPATVALTDELDWAAMQSFINAASSPISVNFPNGSPIGIFNRPLSVCSQSVAFFGNGGNINGIAPTTLKFTNGTDGIDHCSSTMTSKIELHDLGLLSTNVTANVYGINDSNANFSYLQNVNINGFNNCINFTNPNGTRLATVFCINGQAPGATNTSVGVNYQGANSFVNRIENSLVQKYQTSYKFYSTNTTVSSTMVGIEDMQVHNSACGQTAICISIQAAYSGYGPFNYSFENMSVDAVSLFIYAPSCNNVVVNGGNWLLDAPVGVWSNNFNTIDLGTSSTNCHMFHMHDMWFGNQTATTINTLVTAEAGSSDIEFMQNYIETSGITTTSAYIAVANGASNVTERGTNWVSSFTPISPPAKAVNYNGNTTPSVKLESVTLGTPTVSSCGTSPSITGTAALGQIKEGSGAPSSCTISFPTPNRSNTPYCLLFNTQGSFPLTLNVINTSGFTYTHNAGSMTVNYQCSPF